MKNKTKEETTEEIVECEYCGGETGMKLIGDESYDWCKDCGRPTFNRNQ